MLSWVHIYLVISHLLGYIQFWLMCHLFFESRFAARFELYTFGRPKPYFTQSAGCTSGRKRILGRNFWNFGRIWRSLFKIFRPAEIISSRQKCFGRKYIRPKYFCLKYSGRPKSYLRPAEKFPGRPTIWFRPNIWSRQQQRSFFTSLPDLIFY